MARELNPEFDYDPEGDVLYVSLGIDEPFYCENVDDLLLIQRGLETGRVTGFQVLEARRHGIQKVELTIKEVLDKEIKQAEEAKRTYERLERSVRKNGLKDLIPT